MTKDKAKLEEVKAILHELQRIRPDLATLEKEPRREAVTPAPAAAVNGARRAAVQETLAASPLRAPDRSVSPSPMAGFNRKLLAAGGGVAVLAAVAASAMFMLDQPAQKPGKAPDQVAAITPSGPEHPTATLAPDASMSIVQHAQKLMSDGDVKAARQALLQPAESGYPDAAFSLARSYDPNFLQTVTNPNAGPDIGQAETWYRRWQEAAVKQGMVTNSLQLERILRSMH